MIRIQESRIINKCRIFSFSSKEVFLSSIENEKKVLVAMNAEKILKKDTRLKEIINNNIGYADGVGAVMALKQKGLDAIKIPGSEFWLDIVNRFYKLKSFYIVGSSQKVIDRTIEKLNNDFPAINIVGYRNGYLKDGEKEKLKSDIIEKKPDIVFVAQGTPAQEYLMNDLMDVHKALYMGLGGSFDVYTGFKKRAPKFYLDFHLEWLYRLLKEPTRISRQYIYIKFLILLKMKML